MEEINRTYTHHCLWRINTRCSTPVPLRVPSTNRLLPSEMKGARFNPGVDQKSRGPARRGDDPIQSSSLSSNPLLFTIRSTDILLFPVAAQCIFSKVALELNWKMNRLDNRLRLELTKQLFDMHSSFPVMGFYRDLWNKVGRFGKNWEMARI